MDCGRDEIDRWHRERGWDGIGYHYVVCRNGALEFGRNEDIAGAHCKGHNKDSIGICLIGGIKDGTKDVPVADYTAAQWETLAKLVHELKRKYPTANVCGHNDYERAKTCPNFDVKKWAQEKGIV